MTTTQHDDQSTRSDPTTQPLGGIRTMLTTVHAVELVHPHLRRITFRGGDLDTFTPLGPDTFLYVLLPPRGHTALTIDQGFSWDDYAQMSDDERPTGAYYTLREWRPATKELDMLFVLHGDDGDASAWAGRARPGDPVALWGPRETFAPPPGTDWYLLVADDTGLPAVAAILDTLAPGTPARVFAEVDDENEQQQLAAGPGVEISWVYRRGAEPGTTTLLADAVGAMSWPGGTPYVWGGGESHQMTAVRRYVRTACAVPREAVSLVAYWRNSAHAAQVDDDE